MTNDRAIELLKEIRPRDIRYDEHREAVDKAINLLRRENLMTIKCNDCVNSRGIVSENGIHFVCCLPEKEATNCLIGKKDSRVTLDSYSYISEGGNVVEENSVHKKSYDTDCIVTFENYLYVQSVLKDIRKEIVQKYKDTQIDGVLEIIDKYIEK